jgi:hypothetical protein
MDIGSLVLGMMISLLLVGFGYILGTEAGRNSVPKKPQSPTIFDDDDSDDFHEDADWWRKGKSQEDE